MLKQIKGSWFEFQHHNKSEGIYWNASFSSFTAADWDAKITEISETGMEYLVLMAVALDFKSFYRIEYTGTNQADRAERKHGAVRLDGRTVSFSGGDFLQVFSQASL